MSDTPRRYKTRDELSPDEQLELIQARRRGEPEPEFERPEYLAARAAALAEAGFEVDDDDPEARRSLEEMSPGDHLERRRR